jgi:hypothetical protein
MELKGNIAVEPGKIKVETHGNQLVVIKQFNLHGVDLSRGKETLSDPDEDQYQIDQLTEAAQAQIKKFCEGFNRYDIVMGKKPLVPIMGDAGFVGLDCEVSTYGPERTEDLKNHTITVELRVYYDLPVNGLAEVMDKVIEELVSQ